MNSVSEGGEKIVTKGDGKRCGGGGGGGERVSLKVNSR